MKKTVLYLVLIGVFLLAGYMLIKIIKKKNDLDAIAINKQTLPIFNFYHLNGLTANNSIIKKDQAVCIFYFNADCEHCQYQAKEINKNIALFKNTQLVMVSFNTVKEIKQFALQYGLNYPNLTFLQDSKYQFYKWFGKTSVPAVYIYNAQHKLVKEYHGETKIEAITKYL